MGLWNEKDSRGLGTGTLLPSSGIPAQARPERDAGMRGDLWKLMAWVGAAVDHVWVGGKDEAGVGG